MSYFSEAVSLEAQLALASTREQYFAILKITLLELATALRRLAVDERFPAPYRIKFNDQARLGSRVAELWIEAEGAWIKEPQAEHVNLPITGTLTCADGRSITLATLD